MCSPDRPRLPAAIPTAVDAWKALASEMLAAPRYAREARMARLYALARAEAHRALRGFRAIDRARVDDLLHDVLLRCLDAMLHAESPRAFFRHVLLNDARSWLRRRDATIATTRGDHRVTCDDPALRLDGRRALARLSVRDRAIVVAVGLGHEREAVARAHGTSRANVDKIVSRLRQRAGVSPTSFDA